MTPAVNDPPLPHATHAKELLHRRDAGLAVSAAEMKIAIEAAMKTGMCAESSQVYFDAGQSVWR